MVADPADCRDWPHTLARASYRGTPFWVESDQIDTGRRLVVHEFPLRDQPYIEDMGRSTNRLNVTAYVASGRADAEERALRAACDAGGPARLVLPIERTQAHCESCNRTFEKDRLGYIAFSLSFVREGAGAGPYPLGFLTRVVRDRAGGIATAIAGMLEAGFRGVGVPGHVMDTAAEAVRDVAAALEAVRASLPIALDAAPALARAVAALHAEAEALVEIGADGDRWTETRFVASAAGPARATLAVRLTEITAGIAGAAEPGHVEAALAGLADYGLAETGPAPVTPWRRIAAANVALIGQGLRIAALAARCAAAVTATYSDRRAAIQVRADLAEAIEAEMGRCAGARDHPVWVELDRLRGDTAEALTRQMIDLAPVIVAEAHRQMPSLWWAQRLYGDAGRAGELIARNRTIHASFMPTAIEALAR